MKPREKNNSKILKAIGDSEEYREALELMKRAEKEIGHHLPVRDDDLFDYIDYNDFKKIAFALNKKGFELSEEDLEKLLADELERLAYKKFREWVESKNPRDEAEIIRLFLEYDPAIKGEIEDAICDADEDVDEVYLESIIGSHLKYLTKILQDSHIELSGREIYSKIVEIIEKEKLKKSEEEVTTSKDSSLSIQWEDLIKMSGYEFESFIGNLFRTLGFNVEETGYSRDQGADLVISKGNFKIAIQVKRYSEGNRVGNRAVQEITAAINYYKADKGMVITTGDLVVLRVMQHHNLLS